MSSGGLQALMAGVNIIEGYNKSQIARTMEKAQYQLRVARRDNTELLKKEGNKLAAATADLRRVEQSLYNQRLGRQFERSKEQYNKQYVQVMDGLTSDRLTSRLQSSQAMGALAAQAAYAGVAGGSVEQLEQVEHLRQSRVEAAIDQQVENAQYAKGVTDAGLLDNYVAQIDTSAVFADIDYTPADLVLNNSWQHKYTIGNALADGLNGASGNLNNLGMDLRQYNMNDLNGGGKDNGGVGGKSKQAGGFSFSDMFGGGNSAGSSGGNGSSSGWRLW